MAENGLMDSLAAELEGSRVSFGEPMKEHTSLHLGGPADIFVEARDTGSLALALKVLSRHGLPSLPIGGGTNLLVMEGGIEGAAVSMARMKGLTVLSESGDEVTLRAMAGLKLQELVAFATRTGLSGLEGLAGIPGQVGGAVVGNSGAYGYEMKDAVTEISLMDAGGTISTIGRQDAGFGYRRSALPEGAVVLSALMRLRKDAPQDVAERVGKFLKQKKQTQPIGQWSAGCVYKNPEGEFAGRLIEEAGCKGMRVGGIEVSRVHANFFVNRGEGSADDFLALMSAVSERVRAAFGTVLEPEIRILGRRKSG